MQQTYQPSWWRHRRRKRVMNMTRFLGDSEGLFGRLFCTWICLDLDLECISFKIEKPITFFTNYFEITMLIKIWQNFFLILRKVFFQNFRRLRRRKCKILRPIKTQFLWRWGPPRDAGRGGSVRGCRRVAPRGVHWGRGGKISEKRQKYIVSKGSKSFRATCGAAKKPYIPWFSIFIAVSRNNFSKNHEKIF